MTSLTIAATTVNHVGVDFDIAPDDLWKAILDEYVGGSKFRELNFKVEPLADPSAVHGGFRIVLEEKGAIVDERVFKITERDDKARRLSLFADYVSRLDGINCVYATYQAQATESGSHFSIDCHACVDVEISAPEEAADAIQAVQAQYDRDLEDYLGELRAKLEGARRV